MMTDLPNPNEFLDEEMEIVDLDGEPYVIIGELEHEGDVFLSLVPYVEDDEDDDEEEIEFVILKEVDENGEYFLATLDNEEQYAKIGNMFLELFASDDDE
ncbi:MAG: DUF1292 domain-containing protein [Oscillospiraceae bacterium]|nr:DUF1292 domain-containing protein [Oscillospiraceae bacterium]